MEHQFRERALTCRLWAGTTVIAVLCSHSSILLMSSVQPPNQVQAAPKAQWGAKEVLGLLDYLTTNKSQGDGIGKFKDTTFMGTVTAISPLLSAGPPKTSKHCKTKWASVCLFISLLIQHLSRSSQLKTTYKTIEAYTCVSGAHWDNVNGANIQGTAATAIFNSYVTQKVCSYLIKYYLTNIM
jgi:hypothetical protein